MINLEKIKWGKCQPPLLRRPGPAPYFHSLFSDLPPSGGPNYTLLENEIFEVSHLY